MRRIRLFLRLLDIQRVLVRHGLDELIASVHLFRPLRFVFYLWPANWGRKRSSAPRGQRIREALEELGPIYVKFGQSVSTRQDLLPEDIGSELAKLQDQVPPFSAELALQAIHDAYGRPADEVFAEFNPEALAAASIAQVHVAKLPSGLEVIVKILRPNMQQEIERDIEVLYLIAGLAQRYWADGHRLHPIEIVGEYEKTILNELDLMREAANAAQLRRNFNGSPLIYVPEVYWDYCRMQVMVMERIHGVPILDMDSLRRAGTNFKKLAANGVEIFFTQVFRDNFFHADMHPGNIFVDIDDPQNPRYAAVDFGIVGTLEDGDRRYLAENFLAFFDRDYHRVAQLHVNSGWVPGNTRVDELESALRHGSTAAVDAAAKNTRTDRRTRARVISGSRSMGNRPAGTQEMDAGTNRTQGNGRTCLARPARSPLCTRTTADSRSPSRRSGTRHPRQTADPRSTNHA